MPATRSSVTHREHSTPWRCSAARMEAAAGDAEVTSATASPPINGSSAAGMAASDEAKITSARAMVKVAYPDKEQRAAVHRGPRKENGAPRCQPPGRASPDHGHDIRGDLATMECSSTPWRCSAARMERGPTHRGDLDAGYPVERDPSRALDALALLGGQDGGGGGRRGSHLGQGIPTYQWKLGGRDGGGRRTEVTSARAMVKVPYPDKEQRAAVHRGPRKENGGPRCQPPGRASPGHGHDIGGDLATIEYCSTPWRSSAATVTLSGSMRLWSGYQPQWGCLRDRYRSSLYEHVGSENPADLR